MLSENQCTSQMIPFHLNYILNTIFLFLSPSQYKQFYKVFTASVIIAGGLDFTSYIVLNLTNVFLTPAVKSYYFYYVSLVRF